MRNLLRTNYLQAFVGINKENENANGGLALWDLPPAYCCAYNPIPVVRTKYLHRISNTPWLPDQSLGLLPCYIKISGTDLVFDYPLGSAIYVKLLADGEDEPVIIGPIGYLNTVWHLSSSFDTIDEILGVDLYEDGPFNDTVQDSFYTYVRQGFAYADSEGLFCCSANGDVLYRNTDIDTFCLKVYKDATRFQPLYAESYYGVTKFNISAVVKGWLNKQLGDFGPNGVIADKALYSRFRLTGLGGYGTSYSFVAVNAVAQIGESSSRQQFVDSLLSPLRALQYYAGYPLDYTMLIGSQNIPTAGGSAYANTVSRIKVDEQNIIGANEGVAGDSGSPIGILKTFDVPVFPRCVPARPFYIRWINRVGGVSYWMFERNQTVKPQVKSSDTYDPFVENTEKARTNRKAYGLTTENTVTVGASGVSIEEHEHLQTLATAPLIEWYCEKFGKWIQLTISKFDGSHTTKDARQAIEITFNLPTINTQF